VTAISREGQVDLNDQLKLAMALAAATGISPLALCSADVPKDLPPLVPCQRHVFPERDLLAKWRHAD
jgi:hypothetical protein